MEEDTEKANTHAKMWMILHTLAEVSTVLSIFKEFSFLSIFPLHIDNYAIKVTHIFFYRMYIIYTI